VALSASTSADDFLLMLLLEEEVDAALPSSLPFTHDTATVDLQKKQYLVTSIHSFNQSCIQSYQVISEQSHVSGSVSGSISRGSFLHLEHLSHCTHWAWAFLSSSELVSSPSSSSSCCCRCWRRTICCCCRLSRRSCRRISFSFAVTAAASAASEDIEADGFNFNLFLAANAAGREVCLVRSGMSSRLAASSMSSSLIYFFLAACCCWWLKRLKR
jgi:hypothetical protein